MQGENLILNECSDGHVVEQVSQILPNRGVSVLANALVIESVAMRNG